MRKLSAVICFVVSFVFIAYFIFLVCGAGAAFSFLYFWLFLGLFLFGMGLVICFSKKGVQWLPKPILILVEAVIFVGCLFFVIVEALIIHGAAKEPELEADYIVVLGAQVRGTTPSLSLKYRIEKAAEYMNAHPATIAVVSGGQGPDEGISEAQAMRDGLVAKGVAEERIIMEDKSTSTKENLDFSKQYIDVENSHVVVVTTDFHVLRGVGIAKKAGYASVEGLAAKSVWYLIPNNYVREFLAVVKDKIVGNL